MAKQLTTVSAEDFLNRLAIFKVNMDVCQINKDSLTVKKLEQERKEKIDPHKDVKLKNLTQINKNSASPTTVSFGDLVAGVIGVDNDLPVSIKMFRDISNEHDLDFYPTQGLRYEAEVYKQIYEDIIVKNRSPNFVSFIAFGCCKLEGKCMLITERVGNGAWFGLNKLFPVQTLFQLFPRLNDLNRAQVLFQIIYSIGVLNKLKIVHNDLHTVNILVVDFGDYRIPLSFTVKGKRYVMKTRYVPYIFDWDRGYSEKLGPNRFVDIEKIVFNTFDEHRDLYTVFCCLDWDTPVMNTYKNTDTYRYKENNEAIMTLSKREVDAIDRKASSLYMKEADDKFIYKMSRAEFDEIVKGSADRGLNPDINTVYFEIVIDSENGKHLMLLWNPYRCRLTSDSSKFPPPFELIEKYFKAFEARGNIDPKEYPYQYSSDL